MAKRETGTVKWFNDASGEGTISPDAGVEIPVHYRAIAGIGYRTLREGQRVEFTVAQSTEGPRAEDVIVLF
jgi:cold shock protein